MNCVYTLSHETSYDGNYLLGIYSSKEKAEAEASRLRQNDEYLEDDCAWLTIREVVQDAAADEVGNLALGEEV
jgi:hypothetical protein